jgi:hypothetical protein
VDDAEEQAAHEIEFDRLRLTNSAKSSCCCTRPPRPSAPSTRRPPSFGQWTPMAGKQVAYTDVARKLAIPVNALSKTMPAGTTRPTNWSSAPPRAAN